MERKAKVTQDAVTDACDELMESGKNVPVNAITAMTGGSFSTVGAMGQNQLQGTTNYQNNKYRSNWIKLETNTIIGFH